MEESLPPGFRFHPSDEELITYYLTPKVSDFGFTSKAVADVDLNKCEPWDLPEKASMGEKEWYFFSLRDRKYPTGLRTNRATEAGYWKTTGKDKEIFRDWVLVGMKKTLVFYKGRAPKGEKTHWVMHEYRLHTNHSFRATKEEWVVCRIFRKTTTSMSMKKAQQTRCLDSPDETNTNELGDDVDLPNLNSLSSPSSCGLFLANPLLQGYNDDEHNTNMNELNPNTSNNWLRGGKESSPSSCGLFLANPLLQGYNDDEHNTNMNELNPNTSNNWLRGGKEGVSSVLHLSSSWPPSLLSPSLNTTVNSLLLKALQIKSYQVAANIDIHSLLPQVGSFPSGPFLDVPTTATTIPISSSAPATTQLHNNNINSVCTSSQQQHHIQPQDQPFNLDSLYWSCS